MTRAGAARVSDGLLSVRMEHAGWLRVSQSVARLFGNVVHIRLFPNLTDLNRRGRMQRDDSRGFRVRPAAALNALQRVIKESLQRRRHAKANRYS